MSLDVCTLPFKNLSKLLSGAKDRHQLVTLHKFEKITNIIMTNNNSGSTFSYNN